MFWFMPWELAALINACGTDLVDPALWFALDGYRRSLALCILDAVYAADEEYHYVMQLVGDFREYRHQKGNRADCDGVEELLETFEDLGGPSSWGSHFASRFEPRRRGAILAKAVIVHDIATGFAALGVWTVGHLAERAASSDLAEVRRLWHSAPNQLQAGTWDYFLMLTGLDTGCRCICQADPYRLRCGTRERRLLAGHVLSYVSRACGFRTEKANPDKVMALLNTSAWWRGWDVDHLSQVIWRFEASSRHDLIH